MHFNTLLLTYEDQLARINLNRPDKRNAISYELIDELLSALAEVAQSSARVLMITGAGKAFCSGIDLDNLRAITKNSPEDNRKDSQAMAELFRKIYDFPKPTIAVVNGPAIAGGCGIATLCDFTLASTEAKFGYTEVRIGFVPAIVSTFLIRQVGEKQARDLLLSGRIIDAHEAHRVGLVNEVLDHERLMPRAQEIAQLLLQNSPASLASTKRLLSMYADSDLNVQIEAAVGENATIRTTADFR